MTTDLSALMHPSWAEALEPVRDTIDSIGEYLATRVADGATIAPDVPRIFRAFSRPVTDTHVLIVGQDPYPSPGHAVGLSFSADRDVRPIPRSLQNIYTELHDDIGVTPAEHPDLSTWFDQGVMLMNRVLTTEVGATKAHRNIGWQTVTDTAVNTLINSHRQTGQPLTAILWGNDARSFTAELSDAGIPCMTSTHPSPISAYRGFFGSRPFSATNQALAQQGAAPINWQLPG